MKTIGTVAAVAAMLLAGPAMAAEYVLDYTRLGVTFQALLTTSDTATVVNNRTGFLVTSLSGTRNGTSISGLYPAGTDFGGTPNDNLLFVSDDPFVSGGGIGYELAGSTDKYLFYANGASDYLEYAEMANGTQIFTATPVMATLAPAAAVPEPGIWSMMIAGFGLAGAALRHKRRRNQRVSYARP